MKKPISRIKIGAEWYRIKYITMKDPVLGSVEFDKRLIRIDKSRMSMKNHIILHEAIHVFLRNFIPKYYNDEILVEAMTSFVVDTVNQIKSNQGEEL